MQDHFISLNHLVSFNFSLVSQLIGVYPSWSSLLLNISMWACYFQRYEFFSISLTWYVMVSGEESPWLYYVNVLNFFNLGCVDGTSFGSLNVGAPTEGCLGTPSFYQFSGNLCFCAITVDFLHLHLVIAFFVLFINLRSNLPVQTLVDPFRMSDVVYNCSSSVLIVENICKCLTANRKQCD